MPSRVYDVSALGHALVDIRFIVDRLPGPDEEAEVLEESRGAGGSAVNVAIDVSRLGGRSLVIAKVGFDGFGRIVVDELLRERVGISGLRIDPALPTGFSLVAISREGEIVLYSHKGAAEALGPGELPREAIASARILHVASLRLDTSIEAARIAREAGTLVSWDPGRRLARLGAERLRGMIELSDIVLLNRLEAQLITGRHGVETARLIASMGPRIVVVKLGPEGAVALVEGRVVRVPAYRPRRVVDTTGAGDAFAAAFLLRLARGDTVEDALLYASAAAGLKVARLGSHNMPGPEEVERALAGLARPSV